MPTNAMTMDSSSSSARDEKQEPYGSNSAAMLYENISRLAAGEGHLIIVIITTGRHYETLKP